MKEKNVEATIMLTSAVVILGLKFFIAWVGGSAIISGVKSLSGDCGKTYPVEVVFAGDWFCAEVDSQ